MFEPGTTWEYSMSTDVLGRVVEVVSGMTLGEFFETRITGPLGMRDTGFAATGERAARLAEPQADPATGQRPPMRNVKQPGRWQSGGGGAVSTAADYARFCQMLLNGGDLDGVRLLAPKTVALMASDHLPPGVGYGETARARFGALAPVPEMGYGFGLGFAVRNEPGRSPVPGSVGEFFWGGVTGTYFWIDPREQLIAVLMLAAPDQRLHYRYLTRQLVYAALTGTRGRRYRVGARRLAAPPLRYACDGDSLCPDNLQCGPARRGSGSYDAAVCASPPMSAAPSPTISPMTRPRNASRSPRCRRRRKTARSARCSGCGARWRRRGGAAARWCMSGTA